MATEPSPPPTVNRRRFLGAAGGVSGSFLLGAVGGAAAGAYGMDLYDRPRFLVGYESFSQQGEDLVLWNWLKALAVSKPTYLDIGANDPMFHNNTFLFYRSGCRGVLVEPNPRHWAKLAAVRPEDTLLRAGIHVKTAAELDFYVIGGPGGDALSTFDKAMAESYAATTGGKHFIAEVIKVPTFNVNEVMAEHFQGPPHLLSIDTEGLDLDILKTVDFERYRPVVLCVETLKYHTTEIDPVLVDFVQAKGYVPQGGSLVNTVFVDERYRRKGSGG